MRKNFILVLVPTLAIVAFVFSFGITDGHIGLDDWGYTSGCPFVRDGVKLRSVLRAFCDLGYGAIWMPVTFISYMLDVSIFGDSWKAYHAVNVVFHLVNTVLVCCLLLSVLSRNSERCNVTLPIACAISTILWAIHPLRVEAVTFVASRKEELWTMFSLMGVLSYNSFLQNKSLLLYCLTLVAFLLALMSKPTAMCFPFVLMSIAYFEGRLTRRTLLWLLPLFLVSVCAGLLTIYSQSHPSNAVAVDIYETTLLWRVLNAFVSVGLYAWHTIWPLDIHMDYRAIFNGWPVNGWLGLASSTIVMVAIMLMFLRLSKEGRRILVGALMLFAFSIGPTLGVLGYVNGDQSMADRYTYFPRIALSLILAYWLAGVAARGGKTVVLFSSIAFMLFEVVVAIPIVKSYESGYAACSRTLEKDPENWRALRIVGNEYCARLGRMDDGVRMLERSLSLRPSQLTAESLAYVLAIRGRTGDFNRVRQLCAGVAKCPKKDRHGMMLDALGTVSFREGKDADAVMFYETSLKVDERNYSTAHTMLNLALSLANCGRRRESMILLSRLSSSENHAVRACCMRLLLRLKTGQTSRLVWSVDPFGRL